MSSLYTYGNTLQPFETAKSGEVANEFRAVQAAFEALALLLGKYLAVLEAVPTIPQDAAARAGKVLAFDAITGNPIAITEISDGSLEFPVAIALGGTAADTASGALNNLGAVPTSRSVATGTGLTGGGNLTANRTLALDTANTRNVDHAAVSIIAGTGLTGGGTIAATRTLALDTANTRNVDHATVSVTAGAGLTGGGTIAATRTLAVGAGTGITVNADDVALDTANTRNVDHATITITAGVGLSGGGAIDADRTLTVDLNELTTIGANVIDGDADFIAVVDTSASAGSRKVKPDDLITDQSNLGFRDVPQVTHNANYTFVLSDDGKSMYHTSGSAHAWTIPPASSVAFRIGAAISLINENGGGDITITQGAGVTIRLAGTSTTGNLTLAAHGVVTLYKSATNTWYVLGVGVSA